MDDSDVMTTGKIDNKDNNKLITVGDIASQITENDTSVEPASSAAVSQVKAAQELTSVDDNSSSGLPLSQDLVNQEPASVTNPPTQPTSDTDTQVPIMPSTDTAREASLLTTAVSNTGFSEKSGDGVQPQTTNVQVPASVTSINGTGASTVPTSLQTGTTDAGTDNSCKNVSNAENSIQLLSSSSSKTCNVTMATTASSSLVTHPAGVAASSSTQLAATTAAYNLPNAVKLEPSMQGKVNTELQDFNIPFQMPITGASGYNSSKVAAEMAKIDSFLASLSRDGAISNPLPKVNFGKTKTGASKPPPVGSALGNIALSYGGYSEEESSSSSSDESDYDQSATVRSAKITAADAVVAMDTQEVEQSMKKIVVSSDSSSSSSEDELGIVYEKKLHSAPRTKGETLLQDLPPVQPIDVVLSENSQLEKIGHVHSIVEQIVVVAHKSTSQVVNIDTIFWLEDRSPLGKVFEVFGPVVSPYYSIRINQQNESTRVYDVDSVVYFVSNDSTLTYYVFPDSMENQKGSDASWLNDEEPPTQFLEYSDDDEEAAAKRDFRKHRSSPNDGPKRIKQFHKVKRVDKHQDASSVAPFTHNRSNFYDTVNQQDFTCHSGTIHQHDRQSIYSQSIPRPPHYSPSSQEYPVDYIPPAISVNSEASLNQSLTKQSNCEVPLPMPILNTMPSPLLKYPLVQPSQLSTQPHIPRHPPGIPLLSTPGGYSSSPSLALHPSAQLHPSVTAPLVSEMKNNYSCT